MEIEDMTEAKLLIIRRNIYLTIMSSAGHEECVHKLVKNLKEGSEVSSTACTVSRVDKTISFLTLAG